MKKLYMILAFMSIAFFANAQPEQPPSDKKTQEIEALKVAFISRDLELTPEEAQKFWPVYNDYEKEMAAVDRNDQDVLGTDNKILGIKNKYKDQFTKVVGPHKTNKFFNSENKFRKVLLQSQLRNGRPVQQQQQQQHNNNANKPPKKNH